jgi:hypothetical protein
VVRCGGDWGGADGPLSGTGLLERLRVTGRARPPVGTAVVADLRGFLEDECTGPSGPASPSGSGRLVVNRERMTSALACPVHRTAGPTTEPADAGPGRRTGGRRPMSTSLACGALVGALFRQIVASGRVEDPMGDALEALSLDDHQDPLVAWIGELPAAERAGLRAEVERQTRGLLERWPCLDASWLPRTQETFRASLVGGAVELCTRVDLALGRPVDGAASVALLDVVSGVRRPEHRDDRRFTALVAALRGPTPPFAVATYYSRTGELDVDPVDDEYLVGGAHRCVAAVRVLLGTAEAPSDGATCAGCRTLLRRPSVVVPVEPAGAIVGPTAAGRVGGPDRCTRTPQGVPFAALPREVAA